MKLTFENNPRLLPPDVITGQRPPTMEESFRRAFMYFQGTMEIAKEGDNLIVRIPLRHNDIPDEKIRIKGQLDFMFNPNEYLPLMHMMHRVSHI